MARLETITDADLFDFVEGRLSPDDRATVAKRLTKEPALAERCGRVRAQALNVRLLRAVLPVEAVPDDWLRLLSAQDKH